MWDLKGNLKLTLETGHEISQLFISPDSTRIIGLGPDNQASLWDQAGHLIQTFPDLQAPTFDPAGERWFSYVPTEKVLISRNYQGEAIARFAVPEKLYEKGSLSLAGIKVNADTSRFLLFQGHSRLYLINENGELLSGYELNKKIIQYHFSPDGAYVLICTEARIYLWTQNGETIFTEKAKIDSRVPGKYNDAFFSADGQYFITNQKDHQYKNNIEFWRIPSNIYPYLEEIKLAELTSEQKQKLSLEI